MHKNYKPSVIACLAIIFLLAGWYPTRTCAQQKGEVYLFQLRSEIGPTSWRLTKRAFDEAERSGAKTILIDMNTYGGLLNFADSIRSLILASPIPTLVYVNPNAASAGALIALACDKIYMAKGASIGAASVVDPEGKILPEKYQSYMRGLMRTTAEANGRDPKIAEAFVDPDIDLPTLKPKGKILTLTTAEAVRTAIANGERNSLNDLLQQEGLTNAGLRQQQVTWVDLLIGFLINPVVSGVLILLIIGGIYFEMQSPGIGFALLVAIAAAFLFFAPLYMEGLADHWEIFLFLAGVILIALEIFVIPGFGITGIVGIICLVCGLAFSMVSNNYFDFTPAGYGSGWLFRSFLVVIIGMIGAIVLSVLFGKSLLKSSAFQRLVLADEQQAGQGYVSSLPQLEIIGKTGIAKTSLRPSGKIEIEGKWYDAVALDGFIESGTVVFVEKHENYNLFVRQNKQL
ncbi:membrane-bound serine protease (ClpP class) [bacterium A37T11]|nr:membrane-bound serine protease (ClpP class) [bacterium A37T11]